MTPQSVLPSLAPERGLPLRLSHTSSWWSQGRGVTPIAPGSLAQSAGQNSGSAAISCPLAAIGFGCGAILLNRLNLKEVLAIKLEAD